MSDLDTLRARRNALTKTAEPETTDVEKSMWTSPAGKKTIAPILVKMLPAHKVYVEPFIGAGSVFFAKEPAEKEVINDFDPEISFAYQAIKSITPAEIENLRKRDWVGSKAQYDKLHAAKPTAKLDRLYKFLYTARFSYGKFRQKGFDPTAVGQTATSVKRIEKHKDRLKNTIIRNGSYEKMIEEFDSEDTFFFLDPPYAGYSAHVGEKKFDEVAFRKVLDGMKGKFLVTYGTKGKLDTSGLKVKKISQRRAFSATGSNGSEKTLDQLLIYNYDMPSSAGASDAETAKLLKAADLELCDIDTLVLDAGDACAVAKARVFTELFTDRLLGFVGAVGDGHDRHAQLKSLADTATSLDRALGQLDSDAADTGDAVEELGKSLSIALHDVPVLKLPDVVAGAIVKASAQLDRALTVPTAARALAAKADAKPSLFQRLRLVEEALRQEYPPKKSTDGYPLTTAWVVDVYDDTVVFSKDGKNWRLSYTIEGGAAKLGAGKPEEVVVTYAPVGKRDARDEQVAKRTIPILKTTDERYVLGIVLEPLDKSTGPDAQNDLYSADEVRETAHKYMAEFQNVGLMHKQLINGKAKVVESYLAPVDFEMDGQKVRKGTWLLAIKVADDELWSEIKSGKFTGFSIGGDAVRTPEQN